MDIKQIIYFLEAEFPELRDNISVAVAILHDEIEIAKEKIAEKLPEMAMNNEIERVNEYTNMINAVNTIDMRMEEIFQELKVESSIGISGEYHYLSENLEYTRPSLFVIDGKENLVKNWTDLFIKTCQYFHDKNPEQFMKCIENEEFTFLATNEEDISRARLIEGTDVYFDRAISVKRISSVLLFFLDQYKMPEKSYKIYISKVYEKKEKGKRHKARCNGYEVNTGKCLKEDAIYFGNKCFGAGRCQWYKEK